MIIGNRKFDFGQGHVSVMGILNVTPDSFSDGGRFHKQDEALRHVEEMILQGVDIIDVGGESTRPGYQEITVEEEINRVVSMVEEIKRRFDIPVSVDTYKAPVMEAAFQAGADLANDIWGLKYDTFFAEEDRESVWDCGTMAQIIAKYQAPVCIMHNRKEANYTDFLENVISDLKESVQIGLKAGIPKEQMILDPGIGFAKDYEQNLQILANLRKFQEFQMPLLLAASRKSVIGLTLELPAQEREEGTIVTSVLAGMNGWNFVRVHDVEKNVRALKMLEKIQQYQERKQA